jgi:hypothetical protein
MRCDVCRRLSKPDERGWVSVLSGRAANWKPYVFTYCPNCLEHVLALTPVERPPDHDS